MAHKNCWGCGAKDTDWNELKKVEIDGVVRMVCDDYKCEQIALGNENHPLDVIPSDTPSLPDPWYVYI